MPDDAVALARRDTMWNGLTQAKYVIQSMVIVTMLAGLLMAAAVPEAYGDRGAVFAGVYVALQVLRHAWLLRLRRDRYALLVNVRILSWTTLAAVPWIAGIFATVRPEWPGGRWRSSSTTREAYSTSPRRGSAAPAYETCPSRRST